jgi:hypothetical protein
LAFANGLSLEEFRAEFVDLERVRTANNAQRKAPGNDREAVGLTHCSANLVKKKICLRLFGKRLAGYVGGFFQVQFFRPGFEGAALIRRTGHAIAILLSRRREKFWMPRIIAWHFWKSSRTTLGFVHGRAARR